MPCDPSCCRWAQAPKENWMLEILDLGFFHLICATVKLLSCTALSCKPPGHVMNATEHQSVHHTGQDGTDSPSECLELNVGQRRWLRSLDWSGEARQRSAWWALSRAVCWLCCMPGSVPAVCHCLLMEQHCGNITLQRTKLQEMLTMFQLFQFSKRYSEILKFRQATFSFLNEVWKRKERYG